jgi:hypothetical protein
VAQNDACRKISSCFCTTPTDPLHALLGIPPILYTLHSLWSRFITRLERLPPSSPLLTVITANPLSRWHAPYFPPSFLMALVESRNPNSPPFSYSTPSHIPPWSHTRFLPFTDRDCVTSATTRRLISRPPLGLCLLFLHSLPTPPLSFAHTFSLFNSECQGSEGPWRTMVLWGWKSSS